MQFTSIRRQLALTASLLLFTSLYSKAQPTVRHQVFLFGNYADIQDKPDFLLKLERIWGQSNHPFTIVVTGDLVKEKIEKTGSEDQVEPILKLSDLIQRYVNGSLILVPGDRDWNSSNRGGEKSVQHLEEQIKAYWHDKNYDRCHWAGDLGCPGPEVYEIDEGLVIAALNTQWWNHPYDKPRGSDAICGGLTSENLKEEIEDLVEENQDKNVLLVGHHPMFSVGRYGGYFPLSEHLKPFPVIGSFRTAFHAHAGDQYDLANPRLHAFVEDMKNLLSFHDNLIYASGHEKNQALLTFGQNYLINSGAPTKAEYAGKNKNTLFSAGEPGIMALSYFEDGRIDAVFLKHEAAAGFQPDAGYTLFQTSCGKIASDQEIVNTAYVPCRSKSEATSKMQRKYAETVPIAAGPEYEAGWWKSIWFGHHYRADWAMPIKVNYLDLDETFGGLTIFKKGGGRQTTSLKFKSAGGAEFTFRSVNKNPEKALDYHLRNTLAADVLRDQTSTQHPYGALAVASLLDNINILHATPRLYLLPDDQKLGSFQGKYANLLGMLEENPGKKNSESILFGEADKIDKSIKMYQRFYTDQKTSLQQDEFVRARLFDMLIGDWSKHEDNWKWAAYEDDDGFRRYRPIPRDRDHTFSRQDGVINWLADRPFGVQNIEHFGYRFTGIRSLTYQARHMDRFLMDESPHSLFITQARYIQEHITDADIDHAVRMMPPESYEISGKIIAEKLKKRIRRLPEAAEKYYALLAREVDVTGSNEREFFLVEYQEEGTLELRIYDMKEGKKGDVLLYERIFIPGETKEVRLWALGGDDVFDIRGGKSQIIVRAFGGPGEDLFRDASAAGTHLYDKGEGTKYELGGNAKIIQHWNKELYEYDRMRFGYNYAVPVVAPGYSGAMGFGLNLGYDFTIRKFEKDDYHSRHTLGFGLTTEGNKKAFYTGRFHQMVRNWDLSAHVLVDDAAIRNRFFGLGNDSRNREAELGADYFRPEISAYHFSLGLARDFWKKSSFKLNAGVERNESKKVKNTFLDDNAERIFGAHQKITTIPLSLALDLDFRDRRGMPYRGARALLSYENHSIVTGAETGGNFGVARGELEYYISSRNEHPLTLGIRIGGAWTHGDAPWYKLPTLGFTHGLRGYLEDRFVGESSAFFNAEFRYQLWEVNTSIVPMKAGIKVFYDRGRVFHNERDISQVWHDGYGFGVYVVPLDEALTISLTFGFSREESGYPIFSVGKTLQ
jgi:hypothetical protein